jgi:hypothetical protein
MAAHQIAVTSGLVTVRPNDLPTGGRFISKPCNPAQIVRTLRESTAA